MCTTASPFLSAYCSPHMGPPSRPLKASQVSPSTSSSLPRRHSLVHVPADPSTAASSNISAASPSSSRAPGAAGSSYLCSTALHANHVQRGRRGSWCRASRASLSRHSLGFSSPDRSPNSQAPYMGKGSRRRAGGHGHRGHLPQARAMPP